MLYVQLFLIASLVSLACSLPGNFLVLRGTALMSDAISHSVLLGIVLMFFITHDIHSPWMFLGATIVGLLTITAAELLIKTKRVFLDTTIGLIFPLFFSIAVILINYYAHTVHMDTDAVFLGELAFAPFQTCSFLGIDIGPTSLWVMLGILLINILFIKICYKELVISTFDVNQAEILGYKPHLINYLLMTLTSITIIGSFNTAGSILVIAFMIIPPATAFLITDHITRMIAISSLFALLSTIIGCYLAHLINVSITGAIATTSGLLFFIVLFLVRSKYSRSLTDRS